MTSWSKVKWTEALQITAAMELRDCELPKSGAAPASFYAGLRKKGELETAVRYLGHALPRYEAVAWAAHVIEQQARDTELPKADRQALDRTLRWVGEPTEDYRRAAQEAAGAAGEESAERYLALAAFLSGGSIAPPDLPAVNPPQEVCGRLAAAAILIASSRVTDTRGMLAAALDTGEKIASKGLGALTER